MGIRAITIALAGCVLIGASLCGILLRVVPAGAAGDLRLELLKASCPDTVIQGELVKVQFQLVNATGRRLRVERAETSCGCAVFRDGRKPLKKIVVPTGTATTLTLQVDTTGRCGSIAIPVAVLLQDDRGQYLRLQSVCRIRVDPGWAVSRRQVTLDANKAGSDGRVAERFVVFLSAHAKSLDLEEAKVSGDLVSLAIDDLSSGDLDNVASLWRADGTPVGGGWRGEPRCVVTLVAEAAKIVRRQRVRLSCKSRNRFADLSMDIDLVPRAHRIEIRPQILYLDRREGGRTRREVMVCSTDNFNMLKVMVEPGVALRMREPVDDTHVRFVLDIDTGREASRAFRVGDTSGEQKECLIRYLK